MQSEVTQQGEPGSPEDPSRGGMAQRRISRRALLGGISSGAAVGSAAWVIPQILVAKPAAGATMSGSPATSAGTSEFPSYAATTGSTADGATTGSTTDGGTTYPLSSLAKTGLDLERDAEIGATMIAVGWALQRWASRSPQAATKAVPAQGSAGSRADSV